MRIHRLEERLGPLDGLGAGMLRRAQPVVRDLKGDRLDGLAHCALDTLGALGTGLTLRPLRGPCGPAGPACGWPT